MHRVAAAIVFGLLADTLLYGFSPRLGLTVFALLLGMLAAVHSGARLKRAGIWP